MGCRTTERWRPSVGEYAREQEHVNGVESFWSPLKHGYHGTYHGMSEKHLQCYLNKFFGWHNRRGLDTINQMAAISRGLVGKRLGHQDLVT